MNSVTRIQGNGSTRSMYNNDKSVIIDRGHRYAHAYAKSLKLNGVETIFRGIDNIREADSGDILVAHMVYGVGYLTPAGRSRMDVKIKYNNGKYAVGETDIPMDIEPANIVPSSSEPNRMELIEKIGQYLSENPDQLTAFVSSFEPEQRNSNITLILDSMNIEDLKSMYNDIQHRTATAKLRTAQEMRPSRPLVPINYMAERIARLVEITKREPQNIFKDFVKTSAYLTKSEIEELAEKVQQLGYWVTPIAGGQKDHIFTMPSDIISQQDKYLGDDMNREDFTERFHDGSPEKKGQDRKLAGDPRPKPLGIFAQLTDTNDETYLACPECDDGLLTQMRVANRVAYSCDHCDHIEYSETVSKSRHGKACPECENEDGSPMEMDIISSNPNGAIKEVVYECPKCARTIKDLEDFRSQKGIDEDNDSINGQSKNFYNNHNPAAPDMGGADSGHIGPAANSEWFGGMGGMG